MLWEYGGDIEIILMTEDGRDTRRHRMSDLFPSPFDRRSLA
jgi:cytidine deaminase